MLDNYWKQFKSGTDIRGIASDGVKGENINLNDDVIQKIVLGFSLWVSQRKNKKYNEMKISVGHDSRISADRIKKVTIEALSSIGIHVVDCGLSSTPAMFMTTIDLSCDGAIQITASHHPFNRNGLKFFTRDGGLESTNVEEILKLAQDGSYCKEFGFGTVESVDFMDIYSSHIRNIIKKGLDGCDLPLKGFKIVVDAGNGAGGFYVDKVLKPLGANVDGSQFLNPDGMFPNHIPNPEDKNAIKSISKATVKSKADLGIIFDTDVDRAAVIGSDGREINRNKLIAVASVIAIKGNESGTIVTDSVTSDGLRDYIETELEANHYRFKRGYKNVINEAIRLNKEGINCPLAIETSGHAAFRENYFLDDGAYLATKIIIEMVKLKREEKNIESLIDSLKEPLESREVRLPILEKDFKLYGKKVIEKVRTYAENTNKWHVDKENKEGVKVYLDKSVGDGWFLLRISVHDPIMPLNIESNSKYGVDKILQEFYNCLKLKNVVGLNLPEDSVEI